MMIRNKKIKTIVVFLYKIYIVDHKSYFHVKQLISKTRLFEMFRSSDLRKSRKPVSLNGTIVSI